MLRYFGYGSNLDGADLARWCEARGLRHEGVRPLERAWLPDMEPVFHYRSLARAGGALSVRARRGSAVPGVLFEVDDAGWEALDRKEGAPRWYERTECVALTTSGEEVRAITYVVSETRRETFHVPPTEVYLETVTRGLRAHGLPEAQVRAAAERLAVPALPSRLFVYGTLRRGEERAAMLTRHRPSEWSDARARGRLVDLGPYPGLVPGEADVVGELVELDEPAAALAELDEVEDFLGYGIAGSLYRRVVIEVEGAAGRRPAWTYRYIGPESAARPIASGDWRRRG